MATDVYFACDWCIDEGRVRYILDAFRWAFGLECALIPLRMFWIDNQQLGHLSLAFHAPTPARFEEFLVRIGHRLEDIMWYDIDANEYDHAEGFPEDVASVDDISTYLYYELEGYAYKNGHVLASQINDPIGTWGILPQLRPILAAHDITTVGDLYRAFLYPHSDVLDPTIVSTFHEHIVELFQATDYVSMGKMYLRPVIDIEDVRAHYLQNPHLFPNSDFFVGRTPSYFELRQMVRRFGADRVDYYHTDSWWDMRIVKGGKQVTIGTTNFDGDPDKSSNYLLSGNFLLAQEWVQYMANVCGTLSLNPELGQRLMFTPKGR